jgi:hypothetical protein
MALLVVALVVAALIARLPYLNTIPAAGDETAQASLALQIARGQALPWTGTDAYTGPFFVYFMALFFRAGVGDPFFGRTVMWIAGALTVALTYGWVWSASRNWRVALIAAGLVAANPHHIVLNSHPGAATFLMPFFTTTFLWLISEAVERDRPGLALAASIMAGLALQANLAAIVPVVGGWAWLAASARGRARLGRGWPGWPIAAGLGIAVVFSPVIAYNVISRLNSANVLEQRGYLWESNPTVYTYLDNLRRLLLQLIRQMSGVMRGGEDVETVFGLPLVYAALIVLGLALAPARFRSLVAAISLPWIIVIPYFSAHYGLVDPVRFTSFLTPALAAGFAFAAERGLALAQKRQAGAAFIAAGLALALIAQPLWHLADYYRYVEENGWSGQTLRTLSEEMVRANRGEKVYIGFSERSLTLAGIPYVPQAFLRFANIDQEFIPVDQIIGRLFESPRPATFLLTDEDAAILQQTVTLESWASPANDQAHQRGYGLYVLDTRQPLVKPDFVLSGEQARTIAPKFPLHVRVGEGLELLGYDMPEATPPGRPVELRFYWRAAQGMPPGTYMGFVHLFTPDGAALVAQSDRQLGQYRYPVNAWQPGEVVIDSQSLSVPDQAAAGHYVLRAGVYLWPSLERLTVSEFANNLIELRPLNVQP